MAGQVTILMWDCSGDVSLRVRGFLYLNIELIQKFGLDWSNGYCDKYFSTFKETNADSM